jgi:hypothetical protein
MADTLLKPVRNKMVVDDAAAAIAGLLPGELSDKLEAMEALREKAKAGYFGRGEEIRILRAEVAELALAFQGMSNTQNSHTVQAAGLDNYIRIVGDPYLVKEFQQYIREKFRSQVEDWGDLPLLEAARRLLEKK